MIFIVCCEVIEHFNNPAREFEKLFHLLSEDGHLICMTHLYNSDIEFRNWYYRNDPTHVFIYQEETLHYIDNRFGFKLLFSDGRLVIFKR
jgi:2-polyprenyl-3-methyl-5-hydroxy-6-metoxy-1,4-benzoquinol methylase